MRRKNNEIIELIVLALYKLEKACCREIWNEIDDTAAGKKFERHSLYQILRTLTKEQIVAWEASDQLIKIYSLTDKGTDYAKKIRDYYFTLLKVDK